MGSTKAKDEELKFSVMNIIEKREEKNKRARENSMEGKNREEKMTGEKKRKNEKARNPPG
jgi:hypothetical protein